MTTICITGATGFLGSHASSVFSKYADYRVACLSSRDYDLTDGVQVERMFQDHRPEYVVHLAAKSGGILSNRTYPADYFHQNVLLLTHMFRYAHVFRVKRLLVPIGGCSYPARASSPIKEEAMWDGYPQRESAGYSVAKKMALVLHESYQSQHGLDSVVIIPGNLYGEHDNYSLQESHVIPAMIRKFHTAKAEGQKKVTFWGTGRPTRDFVYAGDVASLLPYFLLEYQGPSPVNISSGTSISIRELAEKVASLVGYRGAIEWDPSYPDGQMEKIFSVERLRSLGRSCATSMDDGLRKTIAWYESSYPGGVRL